MYTNKDSRPQGGRGFAKHDFGYSGGQRKMYKAVCSGCGKNCEVPFMPSGNKPVYCSDCFSKQPDNTSKPRFENRNSGAPQSQNNEQLNTIITKLDKIITLLSTCSNDSCCQKETAQAVQEKPIKEKIEILIEKKVKVPKKSIKSPKK